MRHNEKLKTREKYLTQAIISQRNLKDADIKLNRIKPRKTKITKTIFFIKILPFVKFFKIEDA